MLANLESRELRAAITQLYELLDQSVAPPEQARLLMLHAAQAFPESKLFRTAPAGGRFDGRHYVSYGDSSDFLGGKQS